LWQALKPLLIQTFVSELSIETLDVTVLHGPARLNQNVANTVQSGPSQEGAACELSMPVVISPLWPVEFSPTPGSFGLSALL
jgi:hypothetical protein